MHGSKMGAFLLGFYLLATVHAVKILSLDVPRSAWDPITLNCKYDLENGTLYAVKWYKDNQEFFRCFADGSTQLFPTDQIKIYHSTTSQPGSCLFELTPLSAKSGGVYACEVSLDWPTFQTVVESAHLAIVEPRKAAVITTTPTTTEAVLAPDFHRVTASGAARSVHQVLGVLSALIIPLLYLY